MSQEIENLIADISNKFDNEFANTQHPSQQPPQNTSVNHYLSETESNPEVVTIREQKQYEDELNQSEPLQEQLSHKQTDQHPDITSENNQEQQQPELRDDEEDQEPDEHGKQEGEEHDENRYQELSNKLEAALKKISSSKKQFHSTSSGANILMRFAQYERKREKGLEIKRKAEEQRKYHGLKNKPQINPKSRTMASQTGQKPIYERFQKIVDDKKKKIAENEELKQQKEEEEYEEFLEDFRRHVKVPEETRDTEAYFNDMLMWKQKLEKETAAKREQQRQRQLQTYTFKPVINKKSARMLKNQKRTPIQDREIVRPRTQVSQYSFQPKINKKRPNY